MSPMHAMPVIGALLITTLALEPRPTDPDTPRTINAKLSEWKVELSQPTVAAGVVNFTITNAGSIPHAFEVEGRGTEKETAVIPPGATATLSLTLKPGSYDVYCPVGNDSHKHLGMLTHLRVTASAKPMKMASETRHEGAPEPAIKLQSIRVTGGGPVIQILPGPFPF